VLELDAASRTGIDDIREIIDATRYRPMQARAKVFIIDEVHMLSRNAFNALLKTLEEPPPHVTFIFATTELRKVPVTVLSRCQRFDLRRVAQSVLTDHFRRIAGVEGFEVSDAALEMIARAADGSVRDGLSLLDQALAYAAIEDGAIAASTVADMLGLADRTMLFDLMEAVMGGRPADALGLLGRAHADGADPGQVLTDLLELVHVLTRIKSIPGLAQGAELPELERTRGAALAERLGIAALGRAWQILLKGIGEIELAPNRQSAAEMVLIRLCFLADLPPPAELVRRLGAQGSAHPAAPAASAPAGSAAAPRAASPPPPPRGQGGALARAIPLDEPAPERSAPQPTSWREIVAVVAASGREPLLHGYLRNAVHPLRVAPGVVEIRQLPGTPRDLAGRLAAVLRAETGVRWTVALGTERGEPTLDEQSDAIREAGRADIEQHPLIVEILRLFPGARIGDVADDRLDAYGLPAAAERLPILGGEADIPPFAPVDAEFASDVMPADPEDVQSDPWESRR
jgi:DNA polymerase-3 subunit gamma/tau